MLMGRPMVVVRSMVMGRRRPLMIAERHAKPGADPGDPL
jgi:hypothetical protein